MNHNWTLKYQLIHLEHYEGSSQFQGFAISSVMWNVFIGQAVLVTPLAIPILLLMKKNVTENCIFAKIIEIVRILT
jgi:hypothetical protein